MLKVKCSLHLMGKTLNKGEVNDASLTSALASALTVKDVSHVHPLLVSLV